MRHTHTRAHTSVVRSGVCVIWGYWLKRRKNMLLLPLLLLCFCEKHFSCVFLTALQVSCHAHLVGCLWRPLIDCRCMATLLLHTFWHVLNYIAVTSVVVCASVWWVCLFGWHVACARMYVYVCVCECVRVRKLCTSLTHSAAAAERGETSSLTLIEQFSKLNFLLIF